MSSHASSGEKHWCVTIVDQRRRLKKGTKHDNQIPHTTRCRGHRQEAVEDQNMVVWVFLAPRGNATNHSTGLFDSDYSVDAIGISDLEELTERELVADCEEVEQVQQAGRPPVPETNSALREHHRSKKEETKFTASCSAEQTLSTLARNSTEEKTHQSAKHLYPT